MANRIQKMLFNLSTISPIAFFFVVVWWIQCGVSEVSTETGEIHFTSKAIAFSVIGLIGLLYTFYSVLIVKAGRKKLEIVPISVNSVKSKENLAVCTIISYIFPFSNLVLANYNIWLLLSIVVLAMVFLFLSNTVWPSPVLILWGYHFYEISNANGGEEFPLISTRKSIKDAQTIKKVITLWDYFMVEVR